MNVTPSARNPARELIGDFPAELNPVALSLGASIAFLALMGVLYYVTFAGALKPFDVNGEIPHLPAVFSGGLLFATGWFALGEGRAGGTPGWAWLGVAGLFAFMGLDELATIHEHLEGWTGVDWQLLYLPVVAIGAGFWLAILRTLSTAPLARVMWVGGAVAWFLAQVLEHFEVESYGRLVGMDAAMVVAEEVGEMIGSTLFLLAILALAHRRSAQP